jgi:hypothetical protein
VDDVLVVGFKIDWLIDCDNISPWRGYSSLAKSNTPVH